MLSWQVCTCVSGQHTHTRTSCSENKTACESAKKLTLAQRLCQNSKAKCSPSFSRGSLCFNCSSLRVSRHVEGQFPFLSFLAQLQQLLTSLMSPSCSSWGHSGMRKMGGTVKRVEVSQGVSNTELRRADAQPECVSSSLLLPVPPGWTPYE